MRRRLDLHHWILIGMAIGLITGLAMFFAGDPASPAFQSAVWWLNLLGKDIFIAGLKMIIAPLIFSSIVSGIVSLPDPRAMGRIGLRTFAYYFCTTAVAVAIGLVAVLIIQPGKRSGSEALRAQRAAQLEARRAEFSAAHDGANPLDPDRIGAYRRWLAAREGQQLDQSSFEGNWDRIKSATERSPGDMFREDILLPLLSNPVDAMASTRSLGIIFFAILTGLGCMAVGESARPVARFFSGLNDVMMRITMWVMLIAPVAIGCIIASLVATLGIDALRSLAWYSATVVMGIAVHVGFLLCLVAFIGRMSPARFIAGFRDAWLVAFATTSSAATLPVTLQCVRGNLKVSERVANFAIPIGATVNMDGTALYEGVAIIFLIQIYGGLDDAPIVLTAGKTFVIFITAVLASVGAAAVPSAGLITMALVASAVGLPLHYIVMIFAVDHLLDMFRTSTNVMGDAVGSVIIDRLEAADLQELSAPPSGT